MRHAGIGLLIGIVLAAAGGRLIAAGPQAPAPPRNDDTLAALLVEVQGLRAAMEQLAAAGPRVQLSVARLQLEEGRINSMLRRLDGVHDGLTSAQRDITEVEGTQERLEKVLNDNPMSADRETLAAMIARARRNVASRQAEVTRLTADEAQLQQELADAQARWTAISQRLDELERALAKK